MEQVVDRKTEQKFFEGNREQCIRWVDALLQTVKGFNFMGELNTMQAEGSIYSMVDGKTIENLGCFENKFTIPRYFLNLVLKEHGLKIQVA